MSRFLRSLLVSTLCVSGFVTILGIGECSLPPAYELASSELRGTECEDLYADTDHTITGIFSVSDFESYLPRGLDGSGSSAYIQAGDSCGFTAVGAIQVKATEFDGSSLPFDSYSFETEECAQACCSEGFVITSVYSNETKDTRVIEMEDGGQCASVQAGDSCNSSAVGLICTSSLGVQLSTRTNIGNECEDICCEENEVVSGFYSDATKDSYTQSVTENGQCVSLIAGDVCNDNSVSTICLAIQ